MNRLCNLLLVEDNAGDVTLLLEAIQEAEVPAILTVVPSIKLAKHVFTSAPGLGLSMMPDLVMVDAHLPGEQGLEFIKVLQADPIWQKVPIIMLTASDQLSQQTDSLKAGAIKFWRKPRSYEGYLDLARSLISIAGSAPSLADRRAAGEDVMMRGEDHSNPVTDH